MSTSKFHITSLLRTRGSQQYKPHESATEAAEAAKSLTTAAEQQPEFDSATYGAINNVAEFIPTLNFVLYKPPETLTNTTTVAQHVANHTNVASQTTLDNQEQQVDEDDNDDNNSTHTFIISRNSRTSTTDRTTRESNSETTNTETELTSTDTSELLRQEVNLYLSLTDADTLSSFTIDEPTSSITIDMAEQNTTTSAASAAATTTTSTTAPTQSSISYSNVTSSIAGSGGSTSIEEDIEEAIELSEPAEQLDSLESEALAVASNKSQVALRISSTDEAELSEAAADAPAISISAKELSDDSIGQFHINDDELSGGQLAQHFVVDDDDDEDDDDNENDEGEYEQEEDDVEEEQQEEMDDDEDVDDDDDDDDDFDISLPLEMGSKPVHSRHVSVDGIEAVVKKTSTRQIDVNKEKFVEPLDEDESLLDLSLGNQSTADDVSDFIEEPRHAVHDSESVTTINSQLETIMTVTTESEEQEQEQPGTNATLSQSADSIQPTDTETAKDNNDQQDVPRSASQTQPVTSSGSKQTIEQSSQHLDDKTEQEMSSGNNERIVDVPVASADALILSGGSPAHSELDHSLEEIIESNASIEMTLDFENVSSLNPSFIEQNESLVNRLLEDSIDDKKHKSVAKIITDLDAVESIPKVQSIVEEEAMPLPTKATIIENKRSKVMETLHLKPSELELFELTLLDTDSSGGDDLLNETQDEAQLLESSYVDEEEDEDDEEEEEDTALQLMKLRLVAMQQQQHQQQGESSGRLSPTEIVGHVTPNVSTNDVKQMERISLTDFSKDLLEDITEESERCFSLSTAEEQQSLSLEQTDSKTLRRQLGVDDEQHDVVDKVHDISNSSNVLQQLEQHIDELQNKLQIQYQRKDDITTSMGLQLEETQRRGSNGGGITSLEQPMSARDSSSLVTSSTEYRTFQEEFGAPTLDMYVELTKRDELIAKLTDSLQQSLASRENLQSESERLNDEVQTLRKQLNDTVETIKRPSWPRASDQESNGGQRISEISMDLISESDDDLERQFLTDNEEKYSRNSRERQLSMPRQLALDDMAAVDMPMDWTPPFSKQIEQFQKYLTPTEVRLFFMVQKKFDDYLSQELEKCKLKYEKELKITMDQWETEKSERHQEIEKLLQVKRAQDTQHSKEMEDLRKYFETKCVDLEKQFSDDVFSQKSQRHDASDSSSECSEAEQMPEEIAVTGLTPVHLKEISPRKRIRAQLLQSPSHRQITPCGMDSLGEESKDSNDNISLEMADLKIFYQTKIHELKRAQEEQLRKLSERLKYYETRYPDDDFMRTTSNLLNKNKDKNGNQNTSVAQLNETLEDALNVTDDQMYFEDENDNIDGATGRETIHNTSLIIIDQDELNFNNESQVIQRIIEEYENRLQEQLSLARKDIVEELEQQIQNLLSDSTVNDQHWPKELILLREKFTAKSQLEITQLNIKHADEMSRLKLEYEKQLNRKNKRHLTFDSTRDLAYVINERDGLRELSKSFRTVLTQLARCVSNCEVDLNATLAEEVQRLLSLNRSQDGEELEHTLSASFINTSLNGTNKQLRLIPDVQSLLEVVEDPSLLQFINSKCSDDTVNDDFDLNDCLDKLKSEAAYLLKLSEDLHKQHDSKDQSSIIGSELEEIAERMEVKLVAETKDNRNSAGSLHAEKHDSEAEDCLKSNQRGHKFLRAHSLNEQQLGGYQGRQDTAAAAHKSSAATLSSLPTDFNRLESPAAELNFQLVELKNRLIKSETDRTKLQQELDHTINRNTELGQELQVLRDQLSQLNSLNHTDYAEGYGLGTSLKNQSDSDQSSASFAQLQEKARNILASPTHQKRENNDATLLLLQMIEDFCREGDKVVECSKKDRDDLQSQIDAADKQLKGTRHYLEELAAEREQERDEFDRKIERLQVQLRDKEKERTTYANASEEYAQLEGQLREVTEQLSESDAKRNKFEVELKASIDKIFVLREIISELETQVETKALNEHVLGEKVKELEQYANAQNGTNETLQHELDGLKIEICECYQTRIKVLEEKLQNVRPSAEQSMVMDQIVEQLRDIEQTLDTKTKTLESIHTSSSCTNSATEDVSVHGSRPSSLQPVTTVTPPQGSPVHPSPRQHSITMESVQRVIDKIDRHTRAEEAAVKRVRDLEMQLTHLRGACVELQHERDTLQVRIDEQSQRISTLQSRLDEQRHRAEELHRVGTSDLNIRLHDLQNEIQTLNEKLGLRDKQIGTMKQQLDKSKKEIDHLEAQLRVQQQPDRSLVERLEAEVKQKSGEVQKLKDKIKSEMINRLALPDLMETMLADKNEEIDHLRAQLEAKERELQTALDSSQGSDKRDASTKLSARTLSDIVSITEFDEPEAVRRAALQSMHTPLQMPDGNGGGGGFLQQTMDTSKEVIANLTHKRTDDLSGFAVQLHPVNTFEHPHYFQDQIVLQASVNSGGTITPGLVPRQIHFSTLIDDSKLRTPSMLQTPDQTKLQSAEKEAMNKLTHEIELVKQKLVAAEKDKVMIKTTHSQEMQSMEEDLVATQLRLGGVQDELHKAQTKITQLSKQAEAYERLERELAEKCAAHEELLKDQAALTKSCMEQKEQLSKQEKNLRNYAELEEKYLLRISNLEAKILEVAASEAVERENLRKELRCVSEAHEVSKHAQVDAEKRKREIEQLNQDIKAKDERLLQLTTKLSLAEERCTGLAQRVESLEREVERVKQQHSENSSKHFSVDEIAQQVEKELNYSAQLDSNILKAIESEEENNLDSKQQQKEATQAKTEQATAGTDDENFTGERELLNQLEAVKAQLAVERESCEAMRLDLHAEKQHSQEIQEQDVLIIEAMRKRLETALDKEDDLHKQLDQERERCERLQTQLTSLQRAESRRNSSLLLKSPTDSPRKSPRSLSDIEMELGDRLRSEIKLLSAQNERERERSADLQRGSERERQRYEKELQERIEYCERLKREMDKLSHDKDNSEQELEHLQERLTLQTAEIESLESRLVTLQEAETRRSNRRERQHQESAQLLAELQEIKTKLMAAEYDRDAMNKTITQLRFDVQRSADREAKMADALAQANDRLAQSTDDSVPQQFLQKMKEINELLATNTQENRQMAESMQYLVTERRTLQKRVEELEIQLNNTPNATELEERCRHLLGRYLRVESHRKALVYQKRYLKMSLESYQESEQRAIAAIHGPHMMKQPRKDKKKLFKTVALAIIAIQRIKYIGRIWHTGKRIVSKSVFTITQQKRTSPTISCPAISSSGAVYQPPSPTLPTLNLDNTHPIYIPDTDSTLQAPSTAMAIQQTQNDAMAMATAMGNRHDWLLSSPKRLSIQKH